MSFAAHGNWCGPGWSARQWKDAKDLTEEDKKVPAIDALDQACKNHDIGIAEGDPNANKRFFEEATAAGYYGMTLAQFVKIGGPPLQNYLRGGEAVNKEMSRRVRHRLDGLLEDDTRQHVKSRPRKSSSVLEHPMYERQKINRKKQQYDKRREIHDEQEAAMDVHSEEEKEDPALREMMDAVEENEAVLNALTTSDGDLVTPSRPTPVMAPNLSRGEGQPLRGARNRSLTNLLNQVDMDQQDVEMAPMALASASNTDGDISNNTNVMPKYNLPREIGFFTETRSVMLPLSIYFSVNKLDQNSPVVLKFMLNDTYDIFRYTTVQKQTFPATSTNYFADTATSIHGNTTSTVNTAPDPDVTTYVHGNTTTTYTKANYAGVNREKGISNDMAYSVFNLTANGLKTYKPVGLNMLRAVQFPTTTRTHIAAQGAGGGDPQTTGSGVFGYGERSSTGDYGMAWRDYYERTYRNRHVMKCDWRLTLESAETGAYHRGVVLNATETVTTQTVATPTIPVNKNLATLLRFKRIKEHRLTSFNAQGGRTKDVISGSWSPNKNIRRDVVDDERTKVWYPTKNVNSPVPYDWKEFETLLFYNDEMSNNQNAYFNCKLDLLYHVQYRDLEDYIRYPEYAETMTPALYVEDATYPSGTFSFGTNWPSADEPSTLAEGRMFSTWATPAINA